MGGLAYDSQHICFYSNKALSTIKGMKMLGNSTKGLSPSHKHLFYRMYIMLITLYGFQLWYFKEASLENSGVFNTCNKTVIAIILLA